MAWTNLRKIGFTIHQNAPFGGGPKGYSGDSAVSFSELPSSSQSVLHILPTILLHTEARLQPNTSSESRAEVTVDVLIPHPLLGH